MFPALWLVGKALNHLLLADTLEPAAKICQFKQWSADCWYHIEKVIKSEHKDSEVLWRMTMSPCVIRCPRASLLVETLPTLKPAASAFKYLDLSPKLISNNHNVVLCDDLHHFLVQLSLLDTTCCHSSVTETKEIACERRFIKRFIYVYQAIKKIKGSTLHSLAWHPASWQNTFTPEN